jgi:RHS repeat-associated protein
MAMQNYTQFYTYDQVGNILQLKHVAGTGGYTRKYIYSDTNNRLLGTSVGPDTYMYTYHPQHGFIISMPHLPLLSWSFKEEIAATSGQSVNTGRPETTYYQYDSQGKRLRKITESYTRTSIMPAQKNARIYIAGYELYEDYTSGDQTHTLSLIDEGNRFVMMESSSQYGLLTRYQHPDHQGSTAFETNERGEVITYEEYHPFGTTAYQATNTNIKAAAKRYRYTGMERDEETGLSYHNARYYISWLGRWINPDPIGIDDGVNVYAYCGNNPVNFVDSSGLHSEDWVLIGNKVYYDSRVNDQKDVDTLYSGGTYLGESAVMNEGRPEEFTLHSNGTFTKTATGKTKTAIDNGSESELGSDLEEFVVTPGKASGLHIDEGYTINNNPYKGLSGVQINSLDFTTNGNGQSAFYDDIAHHPEWRRTRANMAALEAGMMYYMGGSLAAPFVGAGIIMYAPTALSAYHSTFGVTGGYASMGYEILNQTTAQLVQHGSISLGDYDLLGIGTSGFLKGNSSLALQMVQGASGAMLSYSVNEGWDGALARKKSAGWIIVTASNGMLAPLMGKANPGRAVADEAISGAMQGVLDGVDDEKNNRYE